jgi:hypothetical protein
MKKKVLMGLVLLIVIGTSAVFAQTINGIWRTAAGNIVSIYDGKAVLTETNNRDWKEAEKRGNIGIGSPIYRSIRSAGNLTWSGQALLVVNSSTYAVRWGGNTTYTMNSNGQTMQVVVQGGSNNGSWTRLSNNEIDGLWKTAAGNIVSIYDGKAVLTETNNRDWKEAEKRGNIGIGSPIYRNIRSTGNLTWSGQALVVDLSTYAVKWGGNTTYTMNSNGQTMQVVVQGGSNNGTWTRIK